MLYRTTVQKAYLGCRAMQEAVSFYTSLDCHHASPGTVTSTGQVLRSVHFLTSSLLLMGCLQPCMAVHMAQWQSFFFKTLGDAGYTDASCKRIYIAWQMPLAEMSAHTIFF